MDYGKLLAEKSERLAMVEGKISKLNGGSYTQEVSKHFYLGMVGGSGKNTYSLNKRREAELHKSIENSRELVKLYNERDGLQSIIEKIKSGEYQKALETKEEKRIRLNEALVKYWQNLKVGDKVDIGSKTPIAIKRKNKKSILDENGCNWTAYEIIGAEASKLL